MQKIIVIAQYLNLYAGGAERYIHEVCTRLETRHGCSVRYVSGDTCIKSGLSKMNLRLFSTGFNVKWYAELKELFRLEKPDVIYIHYTVPGISDAAFYAARRLQIPCAVMYHSDVTGMGWLKKILGYMFYYVSVRHILTGCTFLFVSSTTYMKKSPFLRKIKRQYIPAPPGIDDIFGKAAAVSEGINEHKKETPFILFVGKPDLKEKGFNVLYQAWQILKKKKIDINLVVAGEKKSASGQGRTHAPGHASGHASGLVFTGNVTSRRKLCALYRSAMVTVLPSLSSSESFGMVIAEALAAGCPVIGSNIGGIPELIEDHKNGYLVRPGDVGSLVQALEKTMAYNPELRKNIENAKASLLAGYNWDNTAAIVANAFL